MTSPPGDVALSDEQNVEVEVHGPGDLPESTPQMSRESMVQAVADARLDPTLAIARCRASSEIVASLPLIRLRARHVPMEFRPERVRDRWDPSDPDEVLLNLGALHRFKGGGTGSASALAALVGHARDQAGRDGQTVMALSVPEEQLPAYWGLAPETDLVRDGSWYSLPVNGPRVEEFITSLPRGPRMLWRRERRDLEQLRSQFVLDIRRATPELAIDAGHLLNTVLVNNGGESAPELAGARVAWWLELAEGAKFATTAEDEDGNLVALGVGRIYGTTIEMNAFGAQSDHPLRRALYHALLYTMPLEIAVQRGLKTLDLGTTHGLPKRLRGFRTERHYTLLPRPDRVRPPEKERSCPPPTHR